MTTTTTPPRQSAADALFGPDWIHLRDRDKRVILERLRQVEEATRPLTDDPLDVPRRAIRHGGPIALMTELVAAEDRAPYSPLHEHLNTWHTADALKQPGTRHATAAARGHAKTTIGTEYGIAWTAALGHRPFIVIVSATWEQARDRVQAIVAITETERMRQLYPALRPAIDEQGQQVAWRDDDVVFANGVRILGVGVGKAIRGIKHGPHRPTLLVLDDLEDENSVRTADAIEGRRLWLTRVALALGGITGMSVLWVGSILSRSALLNLVTQASVDEGQQRPPWARTWTHAVYPAEIPGSEQQPTTVELIDDQTGQPYEATVTVGAPMWQGGMTRQMLAKIKASDAEAYAAEYQCDPTAGALNLLAPPTPAQYLNPTAAPLDRVVKLPDGRVVRVADMTRACALDPQYGEPTSKGRGPDLAAVVVAGQWGALTFLLDCWVGRDRHGQAARLVTMGLRWGCYVGGVEAVGAQVLTEDAAAAFGTLPIIKIPRPRARTADRSAKVTRALGLAQRLGKPEDPRTCRVYALPDTFTTDDTGTGPGHGALTTFLTGFPRATYDDPVDACVDAVQLASRGAGAASGTSAAPSLSGQRVRSDA